MFSLVVWRCLGTLLVFVHLLEDTSLLVLLPVGLGACVEVAYIEVISCVTSISC